MNYLPSNLEFKDGAAFIGDTSLLDVAKEYGALPCMSMTGNISETILIILQMRLVRIRTFDMQQKHLSAKR